MPRDIAQNIGNVIAVMVPRISILHPAKHPPDMVLTLRRPCIFCHALVCKHMDISEAGQRMSDTINNVRMSNDWDDIKNGWMAFALEDGRSDGAVYDSRSECLRYHRNRAKKYFYCSLRNSMHGCTPKEATAILALTRVQQERGRYNPESGLDPITPVTNEMIEAELMSTKLGVPWIDPSLAARLHIV